MTPWADARPAHGRAFDASRIADRGSRVASCELRIANCELRRSACGPWREARRFGAFPFVAGACAA
ncbi:hypothetical protein C7S16_2080 [Burkholderia thailandensis]|uniref:Uncharacterized protein n=1 Tax=Burkholderia thailandensis TaxID=57975 RepID=A0AAW9D5G9_BURTH|nr:hypothetical protein [Burkholderia thailandensis]MDW9257114.1 hypothetical protein [Burkholderia thailandensis]